MRHRSKAALLTAWLLSLCFICSACSGGIPLRDADPPVTTLPPSPVQHVAPIGDAALEYTSQAVLFLPRHDGARLVSITEDVVFSATRPHAESIIRALLVHQGNGVATSIGGNVRLALYGANPVEVSRDVATVNLAASALQLNRKDLYLACQAIANTLTTLSDIHYVNILIMDKQVGLDIAGTLPMGTFSRSIGEDVGMVYEQLLSQRVGPGEDASRKRLSSLATLYFPLPDNDGIMPEVRTVSFDSLSLRDMVQRLLQELAAGPQQLPASPALPLLGDMLAKPVEITEAADGGGSLITLHFEHNFDDMLATFSLNRASSLASLCYTLTTFLPNIAGIRVTIGGEPVQNVRLMGVHSSDIAVLFTGETQRRGDYAAFLLNMCVLYFADEAQEKLVRVERPVPYYLSQHPRALVLELAKGPLPQDSAKDTLPLFPQGALQDADMLGFSLSGNTLLVNFSTAFRQLGASFTPQQDRLLAYGLVNTLSSIGRIQRVCFFVGGDIPVGFTDEIYWAGDFYKNPGLVKNAL